MKKSLLLLLILLVFSVFYLKGEVEAANYLTFQELNLAEGKLLRYYKKDELNEYYKAIEKRSFAGWKIKYINQDVKCTFISETEFSYYNDGITAMEYTYSVSNSTVDKFSVSGSGNIGYSKNGSKSTFKNGLQSALKIDANYSKQTDKEEKQTLKVLVDPHHQVSLYIMGEGIITNGVACEYMFWIRRYKGGFEYFILQTEYPRLEKVAI